MHFVLKGVIGMINNKVVKSLGSVFLALSIAFSVCFLGGCSKSEDERQVDATKTQLYVSNQDAGIGRTWIEATGLAFEEAFAEYSFEEGKMGVQVWFDHNRSDAGDAFYTQINSSINNIFFGEGNNYRQFAYGDNGNSKLLNLTDVFSEPAVLGYENGQLVYEAGRGNIIDKISDDFQDFLNMGTEDNPAYYGLPFYLAVKNAIYSLDLWNEKNLYFPKNVAPSEIIIKALEEGTDLGAAKAEYDSEIARLKSDGLVYMVNEEGEYKNGNQVLPFGLSAGPDGEYGTPDDGLPATYDEFYLLCDYMAANSVTPFIWPGKSIAYSDMLTQALWRNYEGAEQMMNYYQLRGTLDNCVVLDGNGKIVKGADGEPVTESVTIVNDGRNNGYEGARQLGKYYALKFAEQIANNERWTATECYNSTSQIEAQAHYITYGITTSANRIAMLIDGAWWQQEAADTFAILEQGTNGKYSLSNMRFGVLRLPNATVGKLVDRYNGVKDVAVHTNNAFCFANGNLREGTGQYNATKMFMSFVHSDKMMNLFSEYTNILRGLNYEIDEETYKRLSPFGRQYIDYLNESDIVFPYTANSFINDNFSSFKDSMEDRNFHAYGDYGEIYLGISSLHDSKLRSQGLTAETFFEGIHTWYKDRKWPTLAGSNV